MITLVNRQEIIKRKIEKLYSKKTNYKIMNKKKDIILIDGMVNYKIKFTELSKNKSDKISFIQCPCSKIKHECDHIMFLLIDHFKLTEFILNFLHLPSFGKIFLNNITNKELNKLLEENIIKYFSNSECGICFNKLNYRNNYNYFQCNTCKNFVHQTCMNKWLTTKNNQIPNMEKGCIYCKNKNI